MSLDLAKLEKVKRLGDIVQCRCPACGEAGLDKTGNHLRIYPDGKFGCALNPQDHEHRQRIWALSKGAKSDRPLPRRPEPHAPLLPVNRIMRQWLIKTSQDSITALATDLGVSTSSVQQMGVAWAPEHQAWAFPMRSGDGNPVGIRLRSAVDGRKWAVKFSRSGLFIPEYLLQTSR